MDFKHWLYQLFLAVDQLLNVLVTPLSSGAWADETLSSRAYRMWAKGRIWGRIWMPVIDWLFAWQGPGHCRMAYLKEREGIHLPPEMREPLA